MWYGVSEKRFYRFVEEKKLVEKQDFMHSYYYDSDGVERARRMHGFAFDEHQIDVEENEATLDLVGEIIKHGGRLIY